MKATPQSYARVLVEALEEKHDASKVAKSFWKFLLKNKNSNQLPLILSALDEEYAKSQNKKLIRVFYSRNLSEEKRSEIHQKLVSRFGPNISTFYIEKPNVTGIIAQGNGKEINLSLEGNINKLKQALARGEYVAEIN